ncbi:MAG: hypothetical protein HY929_00450, partial [Euryarchaeota archaeon]|nr:hypothetical protein [Euryarchaeota archaeon]
TCAEVSLSLPIADLFEFGRLKTNIEEVSSLDGYLIGKATISNNKVSGFVLEYGNFWTKYKGCKFGADLNCLETNFPTAVSQAREAIKSIASIWSKALSEAKLLDREPKTPPGNDTKPKPRPPGITIFSEDFEGGIANWRKEGCAMHTTLCNLTWSIEKFVSEFSSLKIRNIVCAATVTQTVRATRSFAEVNPGEIHFEVYVQGSLDSQPRDGFRPILRLTRGNLTIYQSYYYSVKKNYSKFGFEPDKLSPYYRLDNWTKFDLVYYYNGTAHLYIHDQLVAIKTGLPKNYTFSNVWLINEGHSDCHQIVTYFDDVKVWYRTKDL